MDSIQLQQHFHRGEERSWLSPFMSHGALIKVDLVELKHLCESLPGSCSKHRHVVVAVQIFWRSVLFGVSGLLQDQLRTWVTWQLHLFGHRIQRQEPEEEDAVILNLLHVGH